MAIKMEREREVEGEGEGEGERERCLAQYMWISITAQLEIALWVRVR